MTSVSPGSAGAVIVLVSALITDQAAQAPAAAPITLQSALSTAEEHNRTLAAARLGRAVDLAGIDVAGQRPNPEASFEAARDTPHEVFSLAFPLEIGGKRARRLDLANATLARTTAGLAVQSLEIRRAVRVAVLRARRRGQPRAGDVGTAELCRAHAERRARSVRVGRRAAARSAAGGARAGADGQRTGGRAWPLAARARSSTRSWDGRRRRPQIRPTVRRRSDSGGPRVPRRGKRGGGGARPRHRRGGGPREPRARDAQARSNRVGRRVVRCAAGVHVRAGGRASRSRSHCSPATPRTSRSRPPGWPSCALSGTRRIATLTGEATAAAARAQAARRQYLRYRDGIVPQLTTIESMAEDSYRSGQTGLSAFLQSMQAAREVRLRATDAGLEYQAALAESRAALGGPLR